MRVASSIRNRLMKEHSSDFLTRMLQGEPLSDEIQGAFITIVDTKKKFAEPESEDADFRRQVSSLLYQMNITKLYDLVKNKNFAYLFSQFWADDTQFAEFIDFMKTKTQMNEVSILHNLTNFPSEVLRNYN